MVTRSLKIDPFKLSGSSTNLNLIEDEGDVFNEEIDDDDDDDDDVRLHILIEAYIRRTLSC